MFTSKPPFQSSTTDEIYRRARERDYEWPSAEVSQKYISQEAKDLVATMLEDADQRPDPDAIVEHPFFTAGYMPSSAEITSKLREVPPDAEEFYASRLSTSALAQSYRNLKEQCRDCIVGPWSAEKVTHTQIWKEMAAEEKAGLTPIIPLADGVVYRPFDDWLREQHQIRAKYAASVSARSTSTEGQEDATTSSQKLPPPTGLLRQPPQSFAAQQRSQGRPTTSTSTKTRPAPEAALSASQSTKVRPRQERQDSIARETSSSSKEAPELTTATTTITAARTMRVSARTQLPAARSAPDVQITERAGTVSSTSIPIHKRRNSESIRTATLFNPAESPAEMEGTKPDDILDRLRRLQTELERALNSRTMAIISSKTAPPPHPHIVVKWVDYTNKFGLGYILNDGSVGCILRDIPTTEGSKTALLPPAGIFIRSAEKHILRRQDDSYKDRHQPVPMTEPIKFFENNGEAGLSQVMASPDQFRVSMNEDGTAGKMAPGKDVFQHRKRERIILWKKFANYMIAYGRDEAVPAEEDEMDDAMSPGQKGTPAELVTFYQRFGDVGCWVFCDGHLQVRTEKTHSPCDVWIGY